MMEVGTYHLMVLLSKLHGELGGWNGVCWPL